MAREEISLQVEISEVNTGGEIWGEGASEGVEAEAESEEVGEIGENAPGEGPREAHAGEVELGDVALGVALDSGPLAVVGLGDVPEEESAAPHGGA